MSDPVADLLKDPEALLAAEFAIGETRFRIEKMSAMPAWKVLERIRAETGATLQGVAVETAGSEVAGSGLRDLALTILNLPESFVESLRVTLFDRVQYQNAHVGQFSKVGGSEDSAFDGLEPVAVYEVLVRSLAVNFSPSFRGPFARIFSNMTGSSRPPPQSE